MVCCKRVTFDGACVLNCTTSFKLGLMEGLSDCLLNALHIRVVTVALFWAIFYFGSSILCH